MSKTIQKKIKFSKGMISENLAERQDLSVLDASASEITNYTPTIHGGFRSRRGTKFISANTVHSGAGTVVSAVGDTSRVLGEQSFVSDQIGTNRVLIDIAFDNTKGVRLVFGNIRSVMSNEEAILVDATVGSGELQGLNGVYEVTAVGAGGGSTGRGHN